MVAKALARNLNRDLFLVGLSAIVSRYIGETEKNLEHIFGVAQKSEPILFFDEADALYSKGSEVKDKNDTYYYSYNKTFECLLKYMKAYKALGILLIDRNNTEGEITLTKKFDFIINFS